jgi:hypothetical protein
MERHKDRHERRSRVPGTPLQIVRPVQETGFGVQDLPVPKYIEWVVANLRVFDASKAG